jgi:Endosomal/lysosomal potassium channel TMEM175
LVAVRAVQQRQWPSCRAAELRICRRTARDLNPNRQIRRRTLVLHPQGMTERTVTTSRLEAFSDGVLAIAITLLVIEIRPPEVHEGERLAHALWAQWPSYVAYLVSFLPSA